MSDQDFETWRAFILEALDEGQPRSDEASSAAVPSRSPTTSALESGAPGPSSAQHTSSPSGSLALQDGSPAPDFAEAALANEDWANQYVLSEVPGLLPEEVEELEEKDAKRRRMEDSLAEFRSRGSSGSSSGRGGTEVADADLQPLSAERGVVWKHAGPADFDLMFYKIRRLLKNTTFCFTIGISTDPNYRFHNSRYGYKTSLGAFSLVVLCKTSRYDACDLEQQLIARFSSNPRCRNKALGGEGVALGASTVWVYVCLGGFPHDFVWELPKKTISRAR